MYGWYTRKEVNSMVINNQYTGFNVTESISVSFVSSRCCSSPSCHRCHFLHVYSWWSCCTNKSREEEKGRKSSGGWTQVHTWQLCLGFMWKEKLIDQSEKMKMPEVGEWRDFIVLFMRKLHRNFFVLSMTGKQTRLWLFIQNVDFIS